MIGAKSAAIKPKIVIGATTGAANKFAITDIGDRYPESATRTGEQKSVAAIEGASASANTLGTYLESEAIILGAKSKRPAVANTESAKPASRDCQGSAITTALIAKPNAGKESRARPVPCATNKTALCFVFNC